MALFTKHSTQDFEKLAEELRNISERSALLDSAAGIGLWEAYMPKGDAAHKDARWTWSAEFRRLVGFSEEKDFPNVMESWSGRLHPDDVARTFEAFGNHLKDKTGGTRYKVEYRLKVRDGSYRWFRATGGCRYQPDGETVRACGSLNDIHEEYMLQQRAKQAEEHASQAINALSHGLSALAHGNLQVRIDEALSSEFETLRNDFNTSVHQLGSAITSISDSISVIDNGSREIAAGTNDLSKRTEQQAASLEQTAAALDQITANVGNSNKRTEEAKHVAVNANQSAVKSAEVAAHAEDAMGRIEESSQQISNIIGVIDEIAFQTNLLALNAGVEAARAGEAGKGFAVVAQEVRELAQRSAKAAKEIKVLIQNSSAEVGNGVKLVRDVGSALNTIGGFISEINVHMEAIATASMEQSTGLREVNTAVNSMDQATQQNAAMVEQSTAASMSLSEEASKLRELVSQFDIGSARSQSAALRKTAQAMGTSKRAPAPAHAQEHRTKMAASGGMSAPAANSWEEF
jgi:methyl-accepting chemotaxis protein